jgi:hypothetical protein
MNRSIARGALAATLLAAATGLALAQQPGTPGTNPNTPQAGTGNAGDNTTQPGSTPPAAHTHHVRHHKHKSKTASAAASAASE